MNVCVFSDSHGYADGMVTAIEREAPALCFFLGDGERDLAAVQARFPDLPFFAVRGNCDLRSQLSEELLCTLGGMRVLAVHGHRHQVKYEPNLDSLTQAALDRGAGLALFGHTHHPCLLRRDGVLLLNPGSVGRSAHPAYALLRLEDGVCEPRLRRL